MIQLKKYDYNYGLYHLNHYIYIGCIHYDTNVIYDRQWSAVGSIPLMIHKGLFSFMRSDK